MNGSFGGTAAAIEPSLRALETVNSRAMDRLATLLLQDIGVPSGAASERPAAGVAELKQVLAADYLESAALPPQPLLAELARIVETEIKPRAIVWRNLADTPGMLARCGALFSPREIELRAEPYREGAGLALRGFFCRAPRGRKNKFVIFVNTAHHPGAVAAALGHEFGHYIYGSLTGDKASMTALMDGAFAGHLREEGELFADSLVALSAYSRKLIGRIGLAMRVTPGSADEIFERLQAACALVARPYNIDLGRDEIAAAWRVRYLTSIAHFFKLRCALYHSAGL
ncbi:MAG: hypothetical protein ACREQI_09090 [Candidatus Binataceae bacterium]